MNPRQRPLKWGLFILSLFTLAFISFGRIGWFAISALKPGALDSAYIQVKKGESPTELTKKLVAAGAIEDSRQFFWLGRLTRQWKHIKAGEYKVSPSMPPLEIFGIITSGISAAHPLTVREGENIFEVADDLVAKGLATKEHFLTLCKDPQFIASLGYFQNHLPINLEGYLYPDTYFFDRTLTDSEIVRQMVKHFFAVWSPKEDERAKQLGMTRQEIVTLASIIEKETGAPEERPVISSVFHNRLHKKMRLQSDPTTIYGMWDHYHGKIHRRDLAGENPYNTYHVKALPVGPIANPGKEAIQAALYPAETPYLYFVSHNDGTHQFSKSLEEHNQAVAKFQLDPKAREGKSWRDRLKKK